jgi:hypothetical protein
VVHLLLLLKVPEEYLYKKIFLISIHTSHGSPGVNFLRSTDSGGSRTRFSEKGIFVGGKKLKKNQLNYFILIFIYLLLIIFDINTGCIHIIHISLQGKLFYL